MTGIAIWLLVFCIPLTATALFAIKCGMPDPNYDLEPSPVLMGIGIFLLAWAMGTVWLAARLI